MEANGKPKTAREDTKISNSALSLGKDMKKTKSRLSLSRSSTPQKNVKNENGKVSIGDSPPTGAKPPTRNFRFSASPANNVKKIYLKNSDKTIKPPEKPEKRQSGGATLTATLTTTTTTITTTPITTTPPITSTLIITPPIITTTTTTITPPILKEPIKTPSTLGIKSGTVFLRSRSHVLNQVLTEKVVASGKAVVENLDATLVPAYARVDTKTIEDLEKRLENLQSILLRKVEILKNREPERVRKEYKFVAMIIGDESKLMVKSDDARCIPSFIPAKSVEDLNRKAEEFYRGCLLSFIDKLRNYVNVGRPINCDAIYEDLKNEEKEICRILQDWISEFCDESDVTLTEKQILSVEKIIVEKGVEKDTQTDNEIPEIETEAEKAEKADKDGELTDLRLQIYQLKEKLSVLTEVHRDEIEVLELKHEAKESEIISSWQKEQAQFWAKEEDVIKARKINEDLSQQILDLEERIKYLSEKNEQLSGQLKRECDAKTDLSKYREEFHRVQEENNELKEMKTHFLKKLDQRYVRIELQEKEVKLQKRAIQAKNDEIEQLKADFDAKVKENRQNKESLEARSKLIEHLRTALEIDQRKIREFESILEAKNNTIEQKNEELEEKTQLARKVPKRLRTTHSPQVEQIYGLSPHPKRAERSSKRSTEKSSTLPTHISRTDDMTIATNRTNDISHGFQIRLPERSKKLFTKSNERENAIQPHSQETISIDVSAESEQPFQRNIRRRTRDIVVKKYEI